MVHNLEAEAHQPRHGGDGAQGCGGFEFPCRCAAPAPSALLGPAAATSRPRKEMVAAATVRDRKSDQLLMRCMRVPGMSLWAIRNLCTAPVGLAIHNHP